jgi:hypothetical protein
MDRAFGYGPKGCRFDPCRERRFDDTLPRRAIATSLVGKPRGASSALGQAVEGILGRDELGLYADSKSACAGSDSLATCYVVLASRTANAERKPKRSRVKVPETTPSSPRASRVPRSYEGRERVAPWRAAHLVVMSVSYADRGWVRFPRSPLVVHAQHVFSGCSEVASRAVRDRETVSSTLTTPTSRLHAGQFTWG